MIAAEHGVHVADENLRLRRDNAALRVALEDKSATCDALRRENQRWREIARLVVMETERHRLAVESFSREL